MFGVPLIILLLWHLLNRWVQGVVLRLSLFPYLGCLSLDAFVTDKGSPYGIPIRLDAVGTTIFDQICPDAMRAQELMVETTLAGRESL